MEKAVVIVSGGIDSTVAMYLAAREWKNEVFPLSFRYNQRHTREIEYAKFQVAMLGFPTHGLRVIDIPWMSSLLSSALTNRALGVPHIRDVLGHPQPVTYVPFRNMLFLTIALQCAEDMGAQSVVYGAQLHDLYGYWDATPEFVERMNDVTNLNRMHKIEVKAPLAKNSKADNVLLGVKLGVDLSQTYSCYSGEVKHCGVCPTCAERRKAFTDAGVKDPTPYKER